MFIYRLLLFWRRVVLCMRDQCSIGIDGFQRELEGRVVEWVAKWARVDNSGGGCTSVVEGDSRASMFEVTREVGYGSVWEGWKIVGT